MITNDTEPPVKPSTKSPPPLLKAGIGVGSVAPAAIMDIEARSSRNYYLLHNVIEKGKSFDKWVGDHGVIGKPKKGEVPVLTDCAASSYAEDINTIIRVISYVLPDNDEIKSWEYGDPDPEDLLNYIRRGLPIVAFVAEFERSIWYYVCHKVYGWPPIAPTQWRDLQIKSVSFGLYISLDGLAQQLKFPEGKDMTGKEAMLKLCTLHQPTEENGYQSCFEPEDYPELAKTNTLYCEQDVRVTYLANLQLPDLSPTEAHYENLHHTINERGVMVNVLAAEKMLKFAEEAAEKLNSQLIALVDNTDIARFTQVKKLKVQLQDWGLEIDSLNAKEVEKVLNSYGHLEPQPDKRAKKLLLMRQNCSSPALQKPRHILYKVNDDSRLRGAYIFLGAISGRFSSKGFQILNMPSAIPFSTCYECPECHAFTKTDVGTCLDCGHLTKATMEKIAWTSRLPSYVIKKLEEPGITLKDLEDRFGDMLPVLSISIRNLFIAAPGMVFVSSDFSSIEAVILAFIAQEPWKMDAFLSDGKFYEAAGALLSGLTIEEIIQYKKDTGNHHPARQMGKLAILASGYGGGVLALLTFKGADAFPKEELIDSFNRLMELSPNTIKFGEDLFNYAVRAIYKEGAVYNCNGIKLRYFKNMLVVRLPSGRFIRFHSPVVGRNSKDFQTIYYSNFTKSIAPNKRSELSKPKLVGTVIQGIARDILLHAISNVEKAGYKVVMHFHDEIVVEAKTGELSVAKLEALMGALPSWCKDKNGVVYPIKAKGGWIDTQFRK